MLTSNGYRPPRLDKTKYEEIWLVEKVKDNQIIAEFKFKNFTEAYRWYMERK